MKVITANTLKTGEVVFLGDSGWVATLDGARLFTDEPALDAAISANNAPAHVVGLYAIDVAVKDAVLTPVHIREIIRAHGPGNYNHTRIGDTAPMQTAS